MDVRKRFHTECSCVRRLSAIPCNLWWPLAVRDAYTLLPRWFANTARIAILFAWYRPHFGPEPEMGFVPGQQDRNARRHGQHSEGRNQTALAAAISTEESPSTLPLASWRFYEQKAATADKTRDLDTMSWKETWGKKRRSRERERGERGSTRDGLEGKQKVWHQPIPSAHNTHLTRSVQCSPIILSWIRHAWAPVVWEGRICAPQHSKGRIVCKTSCSGDFPGTWSPPHIYCYDRQD